MKHLIIFFIYFLFSSNAFGSTPTTQCELTLSMCRSCCSGTCVATGGRAGNGDTCYKCSGGTCSANQYQTSLSVGEYEGVDEDMSSTSCTKPYIGIPGGTVCGYNGQKYSGSVCCICTTGTCCSNLYGIGCASCSKDGCLSCSPGYKSNGTSGCTACSAGTYSSSGTSCVSCPKGTYSGDRASSCTSCPTGQTTRSTGSTSSSACYTPTCDLANCTACETSNYDSCATCKSGYFRSYSSGSNGGVYTCSPCSNVSVANGTCTNCSSSTNCTAVKCNAGYYESNKKCVACTAGTYSNSGAAACSPCSKGSYASGSANSHCTSCQSGYTTEYMGSQSGSACIPDLPSCPSSVITTSSQSIPGCTKVESCLVGTTAKYYCSTCQTGYTLAFGECNKDPVSCASNQYYNESTDSCLNCPSNCTSCTKDGCITCNAGQYISNGKCLNCAQGTYQYDNTATSCIQCPMGTYNESTSQTSVLSCKKCPAGTASNTLGATSSSYCVKCNPGEYSLEGASSCIPCEKGYYSSTSNSTKCTACPTGWTTETTGAKDSSQCNVQTKTCSAGTSYQNGTCTACEPGTYAALGEITCTKCPKGTYASSSGSNNCLACPEGQTTKTTGSTKASDCFSPTEVCDNATQYYDSETDSCITCAAPSNATCSACSLSEGCTIKCKLGYAWNPSSQKCEAFSCPSGTSPTDDFCCEINL